jgi:predicted nucleotidyltransferase component of viral defense system
MDFVARFSDNDRHDLFESTAQKMKVHAGSIEKDFWVCWVLDALFTSDMWSNKMIFKGGTSLSKVFHLINRFSEDIDLILDWQQLNCAIMDPWQNRSNTQQDKFYHEINEKSIDYIAKSFVPIFKQELSKKLQSDVQVKAQGDVVIVNYPKTFSLEYVRPEIRLEIGPLAAWVPHGKYSITPYAAEQFPALFKKPKCNVVVIEAERTFWEKATILHQQAHAEKISQKYSRHYYDLAQMATTDIKIKALSDLNLLKEVVEFKKRFYKSTKAQYELAVPGTFKLLPSDKLLVELFHDYRKMEDMLFGIPPTFESIVEKLKMLEKEINLL